MRVLTSLPVGMIAMTVVSCANVQSTTQNGGVVTGLGWLPPSRLEVAAESCSDRGKGFLVDPKIGAALNAILPRTFDCLPQPVGKVSPGVTDANEPGADAHDVYVSKPTQWGTPSHKGAADAADYCKGAAILAADPNNGANETWTYHCVRVGPTQFGQPGEFTFVGLRPSDCIGLLTESGASRASGSSTAGPFLFEILPANIERARLACGSSPVDKLDIQD